MIKESSSLLLLIVIITLISNINITNCYGEPDSKGLPSWMERSNLVLVNAVRISPKQYLKYYTHFSEMSILSPDVYPAVSPVFYEESLGRSSYYHSFDMAKTPCFSHSSCDGTDTFDRIKSFYKCSDLATENIAAGFNSPLQTNNQWICDDGSGDPFSTSCASDGGSDGHRKNIMSPDSQVMGVGYSYSENSDFHDYWTQDFGDELCTPLESIRPIHSGSHFFLSPTVIVFMVDFYSNKLMDPTKTNIVIQGKVYPLSLKMGSKGKGIYILQAKINPTDKCRDYYFEFQSKSKIVNKTDAEGVPIKVSDEIQTFRYPDTGFLYTYGENECEISFSMNGTILEDSSSMGNTSSTGEHPTPHHTNTPSVDPGEESIGQSSETSDNNEPNKQDIMGCYKDGIAAHDLSSLTRFDLNLTNEKCRSFCSKQLYKYSGTSMGNQCYCGNEYGHYGLANNQSECSMACGGNKTEKCGGKQRVSVSQSSYLGCYQLSEDSINYFDIAAVSNSNMSVSNCKSYCDSQISATNSNYTYYGLVKGKFCLCGTTDTDPMFKLEQSRARCNAKCSNSKNDLCGGPYSIAVYTSKYSTNSLASGPPIGFTQDKSLFDIGTSSNSSTLSNHYITLIFFYSFCFINLKGFYF